MGQPLDGMEYVWLSMEEYVWRLMNSKSQWSEEEAKRAWKDDVKKGPTRVKEGKIQVRVQIRIE